MTATFCVKCGALISTLLPLHDCRPRQFHTHVRILTGKPNVSHGYVYDRRTGKPVVSCAHGHRSSQAAQRCAERMLRRWVRGYRATFAPTEA